MRGFVVCRVVFYSFGDRVVDAADSSYCFFFTFPPCPLSIGGHWMRKLQVTPRIDIDSADGRVSGQYTVQQYTG